MLREPQHDIHFYLKFIPKPHKNSAACFNGAEVIFILYKIAGLRENIVEHPGG
jgi:hypothetical protein